MSSGLSPGLVGDSAAPDFENRARSGVERSVFAR